ncbi:MAG: ABC transporter ATP-binding protein [Saccharofermentanales bacterium]|jgi:branched-chain amino acid transport system ATP-binding protein|nr:ABC transporter ATP-binding protein [Bacillota bacterium]
MGTLFAIRDLHIFYGSIHAVKGINLEIKEEGELVSLIGANGAGKTTIMHCISGLLRPRQGQILFKEYDLLKVRPENILETGLAQVPEGRRIFTRLTVEDNLEMGAYTRHKKSEIKADMNKIFQRFPRLAERRRQPAGTLSGGEQQMLAIARAMMSRPKLLLMDEPSMGLAPLLVREVFDLIQEMRSEGTTILLVEQNARMALSIADRAYVLETGKIVHEGIASEMLHDERIREAYLGS